MLTAPIPARLGCAIARLRQWLRAEIAATIPWIEMALIDPQAQALILAESDRTTVLTQDAGSLDLRRTIFEVPLGQLDEAAAERLRELCARRELHLSVAESDVLFLTLSLPKAAVRNARESIKYRLLTESPLRLDDIRYDARIAAGNIDGCRIAEVAVCRRQSLERLKADAERMELAVFHMGLTRLEGTALEFTFERAPGVHTATWRLLRNCLLALAPMAIFLLALTASWSYARWKENVLLEEIAALSHHKVDALNLLRRRSQLTSIDDAINIERSPMPVTQLLNILGRTLPHSAWLSELHLDGGRIRLIGNATDPTLVAAAIAQAKGLSSVRLEAVTTDAATTQQARFEITAEIAAGVRN